MYRKDHTRLRSHTGRCRRATRSTLLDNTHHKNCQLKDIRNSNTQALRMPLKCHTELIHPSNMSPTLVSSIQSSVLILDQGSRELSYPAELVISNLFKMCCRSWYACWSRDQREQRAFSVWEWPAYEQLIFVYKAPCAEHVGIS
jgi:uncharacterized CHY-type Zn-finger protein